MKFLILVLLTGLMSCSQRFYIVRHAEKAVARPDTDNMIDAKNPPLSQAGESRAQLLKQKLSGKKIKYIFSTDYDRTINTAKPLADALGIQIEKYEAEVKLLDEFIQRIDSIKKGNVLIVGHSNTVDDIVNQFTGVKHIPNDLQDTEYDNLFIIKRKKGKMTFTREKFGDPDGADRK